MSSSSSLPLHNRHLSPDSENLPLEVQVPKEYSLSYSCQLVHLGPNKTKQKEYQYNPHLFLHLWQIKGMGRQQRKQQKREKSFPLQASWAADERRGKIGEQYKQCQFEFCSGQVK